MKVSSAVLGRSREPFGPSWTRQGRSYEYVESVSFPKGMGRFLPLGGRLPGLLGRLGSLLGHLEVMSATLGAVLCCLGAPWDLSDNSSDRLGGPGDRFEGRPEGPKAPDPGSPVLGGGVPPPDCKNVEKGMYMYMCVYQCSDNYICIHTYIYIYI